MGGFIMTQFTNMVSQNLQWKFYLSEFDGLPRSQCVNIWLITDGNSPHVLCFVYFLVVFFLYP